MNNPEYINVDGKKYKINTDFRVALKCNKISMDETIGNNERGLAIIYLLFGKEALEDKYNYVKFLELAEKYLLCGREPSSQNVEPDMDFEQDKGYIKSSFKYDYNYDPYTLPYLHWYDFYNDLCNLSNSDFGNCCILNRIRSIRNYDIKNIKDPKERKRILEAKRQVALKKKKKKSILTEEEKNNVNEFMKLAGINKKE